MHLKKAEIKLKYNNALAIEQARIHAEQENLEKHVSLINFTKQNVVSTTNEIETMQGNQTKGSDISNRLENFKTQKEDLKRQTDKLQVIQVSYPVIEFTRDEIEKAIKSMSSVQHRAVTMANKKVMFFGDGNKVISLDLHTE